MHVVQRTHDGNAATAATAAAAEDDNDNNNNNNNNNFLLIDVAVPSDRNVIQKESKKKLKYKNLSIEIK
jgi:hypothetical protein